MTNASSIGKGRLVTVFGGSGFLGRHIVRALARDGWRVRVAVRRPTLAYFLKTAGDVGQISIVQANLRDAESIVAACDGAHAVINCVGLLNETGRQKFTTIHHQGALWVAQAADRARAPRHILISALLGQTDGPTSYMRTKVAGEEAARSVRPDTTIIRPSIVFGPEDGFFNRLGNAARMLPILPVIGGGENKFQPVFVGDVAAAVAKAVADDKTSGETFELGGPRTYTFKELIALVNEETMRNRPLLPLPASLMKLPAKIAGLLPNPPITEDQLTMLGFDNVVHEGQKTLADLGIEATPLEAILPTYMWRFRRTGEFEQQNIG